jgi:hypothetical protein
LTSQTAIAASVDLRCYGLTTPRHDGKLSIQLTDIGGFSHVWDIDKLPWDSASSVGLGEEHPESIDQNLIDAITKVLPEEAANSPHAKTASTAFLYLYMVLAHGGEK